MNEDIISEEFAKELTRTHNDLLFEAIHKHYTGKERCGLKLIAIAGSAMKLGKGLARKKFIELITDIRSKKRTDLELGQLMEVDIEKEVNEIKDDFLNDNIKLINELPAVHKVRKKGKLNSFVVSSIYAGIKYEANLVIKLIS